MPKEKILEQIKTNILVQKIWDDQIKEEISKCKLFENGKGKSLNYLM